MTLKVLTRELSFGEAPRWRHGRLWFSDFVEHAVKSVSNLGEVTIELRIDDQPSGLGWLPDGSLLVVSMTQRRLLQRTPDGTVSVYADLSSLAPFHCNDMVVDGAGRAYVGDFGFDLIGEMRRRGLAAVVEDHPTTGLVRVDPDGGAKVVARDLHFPNGAVIAPNGRTLIVAETLAGRLTAFDIDDVGDLSGRRTMAELPGRGPDGIALDAAGGVWVADAFRAECVRAGADGRVTHVIRTEHPCYACALGGDDGRTLHMLTAEGALDAEEPQPPRAAILSTRVDAPAAGATP